MFMVVLNSVFRENGTRKDMLKLLFKYGTQTKLTSRSVTGLGQNLLHLFIIIFDDENYPDAVETAEILIDNGISIDSDCLGMSPLYLAISVHDYSHQNIPLISYLISKGADVDENLVVNAAQSKNAKITELLLSNGADVNAKNSLGWTALQVACLHNREKTISLLIQKGAKFTEIVATSDSYTKTAFSLLDPSEPGYEQCAIIILKEYAKLKFANIYVPDKDINLIYAKPKIKEHFEKCMAELALMKNTEFSTPFSFYSILKKNNMKKLAVRAKNPGLASKFEKNLSTFSYYKNDLQIIWEEIIQLKNNFMLIESRLDSIFGCLLPKVTIRKLSENFTLEDLPMQ